MQILLNKCFGGFGFNGDFLRKVKSIKPEYVYTSPEDGSLYIDDENNIEMRTDPVLINLVKEAQDNGEDINSMYSDIQIEECPKFWKLKEYDGEESLFDFEKELNKLYPDYKIVHK